MNGPAPWRLATELVFCCVPRTYPEWDMFAVKVAWRSENSYAVTGRGGVVYSRTGARQNPPVGVYERQPSGRSDYFKRTYRFTHAEAIEIAEQLAPRITIGPRENRMGPSAYMAWDDKRKREQQR